VRSLKFRLEMLKLEVKGLAGARHGLGVGLDGLHVRLALPGPFLDSIRVRLVLPDRVAQVGHVGIELGLEDSEVGLQVPDLLEDLGPELLNAGLDLTPQVRVGAPLILDLRKAHLQRTEVNGEGALQHVGEARGLGLRGRGRREVVVRDAAVELRQGAPGVTVIVEATALAGGRRP